MTLSRTRELPSLKETFGSSIPLMQAFKRARIKSIVPVMLLPREALRELPGIKASRSMLVTRLLSDQQLMHRQVFEKELDFINKQFGCVEDAPVSALHVVTIHDLDVARPIYAPLRLLHFLEEVEPAMTVMDLVQHDENDIMAMATKYNQLGPVGERANKEIEEINWRLFRWSPELRVQQSTWKQRRHLHAVGG